MKKILVIGLVIMLSGAALAQTVTKLTTTGGVAVNPATSDNQTNGNQKMQITTIPTVTTQGTGSNFNNLSIGLSGATSVTYSTLSAGKTFADGAQVSLTSGYQYAQRQDLQGRTLVRTDHNNPFFALVSEVTTTALTQLVATPGAGQSLYITDISMTCSAASTTTANQLLQLKYGTGTNCASGTAVLFSCYNTANGGCALPIRTPIKVPNNNALCYMDSVSGSKTFFVSGFTAP